MNRICFFVLQILFFISTAHSEGVLLHSGSVPAFPRAAEVLIHSDGGAFVLPMFQPITDLLAEVSSEAARWLGPSALILKLRQLFQQNLKKANEIAKEAERRTKLKDDLFKSEKTWAELQNERKQRIKELREKLFEHRCALRLNQDQPSEEEMRDELHELLTKPFKLDLGQEDEKTEMAALDLKPGMLEQPVKAANWGGPQGWIAPGATAPEPAKNLLADEAVNSPETAALFVRTEARTGVSPHRLLGIQDIPCLEWKLGRATETITFDKEGWRLPTVWELFVLFEKVDLREDWRSGVLWSSTQFDANNTICMDFTEGCVRLIGPNEFYKILRVRSIATPANRNNEQKELSWGC